jgi:hypothetical protein
VGFTRYDKTNYAVMKKLLTLILGDLRQIARDKTLFFFLLGPVFLILYVKLFVPFITDKYPVLVNYHPMIMMFGSIQTAIMFGFVTSFIILEEKDENVLQVIRVLPISPLYFIVYRLSFACLFSTLGAFMMIHLGGIAYPGVTNAILLSIQYGLTAPLITLIISTYANNKVEGMAYFKGVDLILLLPMLTFFISGSLKYLFYIIPAYWTYSLFETGLNDQPTGWHFSIGLSIYMVAIVILFMQFRKRVFDR